jgi:hypothetical protein
MISTHLCLLVYFCIFNDCKLNKLQYKQVKTLKEFSALGDFIVQVNILWLYLHFRLPWDTYKRGIYRGTDMIRKIIVYDYCM